MNQRDIQWDIQWGYSGILNILYNILVYINMCVCVCKIWWKQTKWGSNDDYILTTWWEANADEMMKIMGLELFGDFVSSV